MFNTKAVLWTIVVTVVLSCIVCSGFSFPEMGVAFWEAFHGILSAFLVFSVLVIAYRVIDIIGVTIKRKKSEENRKEFERKIGNKYWLAVCIIIVVGYPMISYLKVVHSPVAEGEYIVEGEYYVHEEAGLPKIYPLSGKALLKVRLEYNYDFEERTTYYGGYEDNGAQIVVNEMAYLEEVTIPDLQDRSIDCFRDMCPRAGEWVEDEIHINGDDIIIHYRVGELTDELLGYTYWDRVHGISLVDKLQFAFSVFGAMISVSSYYLIKNHYR